MTRTVVTQCFSTADEETTIIEANPQIDSRFATHVTLAMSLHNKDMYPDNTWPNDKTMQDKYGESLKERIFLYASVDLKKPFGKVDSTLLLIKM